VSKLLHVVLPKNIDLTNYRTFGHVWYKPRTGKEWTLVAYRKLRYFLITTRLQNLFMSLKTFEYMTCYHSHDAVDGVLIHPFNGEA